jgi:transcriptional regulator with XRE-family HTH domain
MPSSSRESVPAPGPTKLGEKVRSRRRELGLTLKDVGQATGVSVPFLSQIENGVHTPSLTTLFKLSPILRITPEWLLGGTNSGPVAVVRATEGDVYAVTSDKDGAIRRQISAGDEQLAVSDYEVPVGATFGSGFHSSPGRQIIYMVSGRLKVELRRPEGLEVFELGAGDTMTYSAEIEHRWTQIGRGRTRFLNVISGHL